MQAVSASESTAELAVSEARRAHMALLERGLQYVKCGDFGNAELYYGDALARAREELDGEHRDVVNISRTLANVFTQQGKHEESEPLHRAVLQAMERQHGEGHVMTASALASLAQALRGMGRDDEAAPLAARAAAVMENGVPANLVTSSSGEEESDDDGDESSEEESDVAEHDEQQQEEKEQQQQQQQEVAEAKGAAGDNASLKGAKGTREGHDEERQPLAERKEQDAKLEEEVSCKKH